MNREIAVLTQLLQQVHDAQKIANNVNKWSWLDIFSDSFLVGMVKRDKIQRLNEALEQVYGTLSAVRAEFPEMLFTDVTGVRDRTSDWVWDTILDNPFTDFRVRGEIKKVRKQLEELEAEVQRALAQRK